MKKILLASLLLASLLLATAFPQSGRRVSAPTTTQPVAPIQPPVNPEPEPRPEVRSAPAELTFIPESLRDREIKSIDNGSFRLSDFGGKVIVINIWASWCGPCRREVPEYEKVRKSYAARNVEFIGLTTEDPRSAADRVNKFVRDLGFGFRLGWADRDTARMLMSGRAAIPQTLVIDPAGRVVQHWGGYSPGQSGNRLKQEIEKALVGSP